MTRGSSQETKVLGEGSIETMREGRIDSRRRLHPVLTEQPISMAMARLWFISYHLMVCRRGCVSPGTGEAIVMRTQSM